ncbi:4Fe-4S dicluster domain-containing protein [Elusimicrobiota bacterium]
MNRLKIYRESGINMLAIDLDKCYGNKKILKSLPGLYNLIEKGIRVVVCRHCENPPCVAACPVEALEKGEGDPGDIKRYDMKCVSCKQCATACPVGANPSEVLKYRTYSAHKINIGRCKKLLPEGAISEIEEASSDWTVIDGEFAVKAMGWK